MEDESFAKADLMTKSPGCTWKKIGVVLTKAQAEYLGASTDGPYKPEHYCY